MQTRRQEFISMNSKDIKTKETENRNIKPKCGVDSGDRITHIFLTNFGRNSIKEG